MSSCKSVITLALSKLGIAGGAKAPRQVDLELGLTTLQGYFRSLIDSGALGRARSIRIDSDYTAKENDRILRVEGATGDISFPSVVTDTYGSPLCGSLDYGLGGYCTGKPRPPRNGCFVIVNDEASGNSFEAIYDGYRNDWITIGDLSLDDNTHRYDGSGALLEIYTSEAPLSNDVNGLAAALAMRLADHFGATLHPATARDASRFEAALVLGFGDDAPREPTGSYW